MGAAQSEKAGRRANGHRARTSLNTGACRSRAVRQGHEFIVGARLCLSSNTFQLEASATPGIAFRCGAATDRH